MAVSALRPVHVSTVAASGDLRLDPHHYLLFEVARTVAEGIEQPLRLREPLVSGSRNGLNLPQDAYATEGDDEYLYVSVGALSQYALRADRCQPLKAPEAFAYRPDLQAERCRETEVIITRSGTPGIAWAPSLAPNPGPTLIPSGFVIRVEVDVSVASTVYLAAVLNHPIWRLWTASLAGGKRQRNLSQEHIAELAVPTLSAQDQEAVAAAYVGALGRIDAILGADVSVRGLCDETITAAAGVAVVPLTRAATTFDLVAVSVVAASPSVRMDARFHRSDVRASLAVLDGLETVELRGLLRADVVKGKQPVLLVGEDATGGRVVATASIQAGQVQDEMLKVTTDEAVADAGTRAVRDGDVLVAMDGEGSIGKAAVYRGDEPAVTDSHVGILRLLEPGLAGAIACFLNSSLGQAQIEVSISGSTGQTQLSKGDLEALRVPVAVLEAAPAVRERYERGLRSYEPVARRVRRELCGAQETITERLLAGARLSSAATATLEELGAQDALLACLDRLKPNMF